MEAYLKGFDHAKETKNRLNWNVRYTYVICVNFGFVGYFLLRDLFVIIVAVVRFFTVVDAVVIL